MKMMKPYLGFIPFAVVVIPVSIAAIRQALFYTGCMDGYGYMLIALAAFMIGGVLNCAYLLYVLVDHRNYLSLPVRRQAIIAKVGVLAALLLLLVQAILVAGVVWKKLTMN
jgi:hypothetical protein